VPRAHCHSLLHVPRHDVIHLVVRRHSKLAQEPVVAAQPVLHAARTGTRGRMPALSKAVPSVAACPPSRTAPQTRPPPCTVPARPCRGWPWRHALVGGRPLGQACMQRPAAWARRRRAPPSARQPWSSWHVPVRVVQEHGTLLPPSCTAWAWACVTVHGGAAHMPASRWCRRMARSRSRYLWVNSWRLLE